MLKRIIIVLISIIPLIMSAKNDEIAEPDFAYPKQVIKEADAMLHTALKTGDGTKVVEALIQSGLAQTAISPDSLPSVVRRIEGVAAETRDEVTHALLDMLLAQIYTQYYQDNKYNLDHRPALADPGIDITMWSGKEVKEKVYELYSHALSHAEALKKARTEDYASIITCGKADAIFYPTLYDFASYTAVEGLSSLSDDIVRVLSPIYLVDIRLQLPNVLAKPSREAIEISNRWVDSSQGAPRIAALLQRCKLLNGYVVDGDDSTVKMLLRLYEENKATEYAVEFLLIETPTAADDKVAVYKALNDFADKNPAYFRINEVRGVIAELSTPAVRLTYPTRVARGEEIEVGVEMDNVNATEVQVYRVKDVKIDKSDYSISDCYAQPVATIPVECEGSIPFSDSRKIKVRLEEYGIYLLATTLKNVEINRDLEPIYCSDIAMLDVEGKDLLRVFAVDGRSGAPQSGVTITSYENDRAELSKLRSHVTGADGSADLNKGSLRNILITATKDNDTYCPGLREYLYRRSEQGINTTAFIRPSLAIYHPGDSLDFVAVVYEYQGDSRKLVKGANFTATLRDVNDEVVDTLAISTDNYGRASGRFAIPEECLTGYFTISIGRPTPLLNRSSSSYIGYQHVMVSDYKLPTYEVKVDSVAIDDSDGKVTIVGKALTYSGFPVQNAVVEASLSGIQRMWWQTKSVKYHIDTISTDATGVFRWELSKDVLDATPYEGGRYEAQFTVTSPTGENRQCTHMFSLNKENSITITEAEWYAAAQGVRLDIGVSDPLGTAIDATLRLTFAGKDGDVLEIEGKSSNGEIEADLSRLHSGTYTLTVKSLDVEAKDAEASVVVYNAKEKACPVDGGMWTPSSSVKADATTRKAELIVGIPVEQPHVLMTIYDSDKLIEQQWIKANQGLNKIAVTVPDTLKQMSVRLSMVRQFEAWYETFSVKVADPDAAIKVKIERMRDKMAPLTEESVTVKVSNAAGKGVGAAVILDMYSKALDNLATQSWMFSPSSGYMPTMGFDNSLSDNGSIRFVAQHAWRLPSPAMGYPQFNFYDMSWTGDMIGVIAYGLSCGAARPLAMMKNSRNELLEDEEDMEYCAREEDAIVEDADAGDEAAEEPKAEQEYRPSEVPLAFFAPMLSSDGEGNLTYSFRLPNANTTWVLNALAYTDNLATGIDIREAIASKPVMVEPNMPRYLRTGDEATIRALLMNATDAEAAVRTTFEIVNPATGEVVDTQAVDTVVAAKQSATVNFGITAPATPGTLMVRVKASTDTYSDGVMTLLPILSSSQPVVDATTYYLAPEQKEYVERLPGAGADATVTLSFCENPTWEVVSALPGLRTDEATTSLAASAQIFAAAVADYVLELNPAIKPVLKEWLSAAEEGNMLSMLNRNDDLKQLVLAATPWVEEAENDEQRIARLAILFDGKETARAIATAVKKLEKMQRRNGGWPWSDYNDEPSEWATLHILNNFAELRQLGCCPSELDDMVEEALDYIDTEVARTYAKYPKTTFEYYAYVRSLYPEHPMSTGAQKAYDYTVQQTLKNWKKSATAGKAADALLLYRSGYQNVAKQILNSLREYASQSPEMGMWWDSLSSWQSHGTVGQTAFILQAFNTIEPGCAEIDPIRQWLILNKIVQDWGTSVDASACVAAILQCGTSWLNRPGDAVITIDGKKVEPERFDRLTGKVLTTVTDAGGELKIERSAEGPAWGAVVKQSTQVMKEVEAHSIPELSVSKEHYVRTDGGWAPADTLSVGQVVKVRLVIKSMRAMDYVTVVDNRAATLEPVVQTPRPVYCDGIVFYLENRDAATNLFIDYLPKGQYVIEYEMNVNNAGSYSSGIATIQSQYTPEMTAHSAGMALTVTD